MSDIDGWEDVLCEGKEGLPELFFERHFLPSGADKSENLALYTKNDLWYIKNTTSSEFIAEGLPYCEADRILFKKIEIHLPAPEKMSKYGVRVCG